MVTIPEALEIASRHLQSGRLGAAEQIYQSVLATDPDQPDVLHLLGLIANKVGRPEVAVEYIGRAIALNATRADLHNDLGLALQTLGHLDAATAAYRRALELNPDLAVALGNLGLVLQLQGRLAGAVAAYRRALELKPDFVELHGNLGRALLDLGELEEAGACCRRTLELIPGSAEMYSNLALVQHLQGDLDGALASCRRALELQPNSAGAHDNLLLTLQYCPGVPLAELAAAHAEYERHFAAPLCATWRLHGNAPLPGRRLRLGFVSGSFSQHPVGRLLIRVLESLDRTAVDVLCYNCAAGGDAQTARFQAAATSWRDVAGDSDERLAEEIRSAGVDILFDLAGHTAPNRLLVFARKPAPIQITWAGYQATTGLSAMDYLLTDRCGVPESTEPYYTEKILRLPDGYACFEPPADAPDVRALPAIERGFVTFGSCNNPAKINPEVVAVWARILTRLPQSRLVLKYRGLDDPGTRGRYQDLLARQGVPPQRVDLLPHAGFAERFDVFHGIDIGLDTFPYSGSMTSCEALWMGVPVVTWPSQRFVGRQTMGHLMNIGLTETVARNLDDYVEIATRLAHDLPRLAAIRARLRDQMAASPLCDGPRFARNLMALLRDVWRRWCEGANGGQTGVPS